MCDQPARRERSEAIRIYSRGHEKLIRHRGKARYCLICGRFDSSRRYDWANLTGKYEDPGDYWPLCRPCHRDFDMTAERRAQYRALAEKGRQVNVERANARTHCQNGHPLTGETAAHRTDAGGIRCRKCTRESHLARQRNKGVCHLCGHKAPLRMDGCLTVHHGTKSTNVTGTRRCHGSGFLPVEAPSAVAQLAQRREAVPA